MKNIPLNTTPPRNNLDVTIVHKITELYKDLYKLADKVPKRDKFGIYLKIENICLDTLQVAINAALKSKEEKKPLLLDLHLKVENLKHLIRICHDLKILETTPYIYLEEKLQEISKMALGWLKYVT